MTSFGPASEKQRMFLTCKADIVIYGGGRMVPPH